MDEATEFRCLERKTEFNRTETEHAKAICLLLFTPYLQQLILYKSTSELDPVYRYAVPYWAFGAVIAVNGHSG